MRLLQTEELDFNDVLILPQRSTIKSRKDVSIEREFKFLHSGKTWKGCPIIAANMMTGSMKMASALAKFKMLTALHKHYSAIQLINFWQEENIIAQNNTFYTLGIRNDDLIKYNQVCNKLSFKPNFICIDAPSAHLEIFVEFLKNFRKENPEQIIMAGNVATGSMAEELILAGADIIKCGISGGANCLTRKLTGVGRPMISTIEDCSDKSHGLKGHITSDGGCVYPADLFKAFCAGADFVMIGSILAGSDECEGDIVEHNGKLHKEFFGMSSTTAMNKFYGGKDLYRSSEGRTTLVPCKGKVDYIIEDILGGIRSGLSYIGAEKLKYASKRATFIKTSNQLNKSMEKYTTGN